MALTNYTTLQTAITTMAMRTGDTDFTSFLPDAILMAEQVMQYGTDDMPALRTADMEQTSTGPLTSGSAALPTDYLQWREVRVANYPPLDYVEPGWMDNAYPTGRAGVPGYFTIEGATLVTAPVSNSTVTLNYYKKIPDLATNTTNWVLTKHPGLYLYGSLIHCAPFMMDDQRIATWAGLYKGMVNGLNRSDRMARFARSSTRLTGPTP